MESVVSLLMGLLGVAIGFYVRSAFYDPAIFNRVRGFVLSTACALGAFWFAWYSATRASHAVVDAYWKHLPAGHWVDWGMLNEKVEGGAVPLWAIGAVASSAVFLLVLDTLADAKGAVGVVARVHAILAHSQIFMRLRRYALAAACVLCASGIGWNVGVTKVSEVLSLHFQTSIASGWVDWFRVDGDILQSTAPWWLGGAIVLASVGLAILGRVADSILDPPSDDELRSRIIIPTTYRSRRP